MTAYECFCGVGFAEREELVQHNVDAHGWTESDSRKRVLEKYPL